MLDLDLIAAHLEGQSVGVRATNLFIDSAPDSPDAMTLIEPLAALGRVEYAVSKPTGPAFQTTEFQVFVRAATYTAAATQAATVEAAMALLLPGNVLAGIGPILMVTPWSAWLRDERNRTILRGHYRATLPSTF